MARANKSGAQEVVHYCPSCGASLTAPPVGAALRCRCCRWYLITRAEWEILPPVQQGYALYMQGSWPAGELARVKNPYAEGTPECAAFRAGEQRAVLNAQDSEE